MPGAQGQPSRHTLEWTFNPLWVRIDREDHEEFGLERLYLVARGHRISLGRFLGPEEKESFDNVLAPALREARRGPTYNPRDLIARVAACRKPGGRRASPPEAGHNGAMMNLALDRPSPCQARPRANAALRDYDAVRRAIAFISESWRVQPTSRRSPTPPR